MKSVSSLLIALVALTLAGCSGSDGDTASPSPVPVGSQPPAPSPPVATAPQFTVVAGNTGGPGAENGVGRAARFNSPRGVAVGRDNTVYIADTYNNLIRKISAGTVTTLAGMSGTGGYADGAGTMARFGRPSALSVDTAQNVFVADTGNRVIRKIDASGIVTTVAGTPEVAGTTDGTGSAAQFSEPVGLANDNLGNLYVVDKQYTGSGVTPVLRKITANGNVTTLRTNDSTFAVRGDGIAADQSGNLYLIGVIGSDTTDIPNPLYTGGPASPLLTIRTPKLLRISAAGDVSTLGVVRPDRPNGGLAVDFSGNVYFTNTSYHTVYRYTPASREISVFAGAFGPIFYGSHGAGDPASLGSSDGVGTAAQFNFPVGISVDSDGNLFIADQFNHAIRKSTPSASVTTIAGAALNRGAADGAALVATFGESMTGSAIDGAGNVYITDEDLHVIRKIATDGQVVTVAGQARQSGSADGQGSAALFNTPRGIASDSMGNLYIADSFNRTIRKVAATGQVTTIAGNPASRGLADGIGTGAQFQSPRGLVRDTAGNLFVTDSGVIRKITPAGVVSTVAGSPDRGGTDRDGVGAAATFNNPYSITVDSSGNLYVADFLSYTIRKITPAGVVTTIAGKQGEPGNADGPGATARFVYPSGIVVDAAGNLYVSDSGNSAVRKITPAGVVSTLIALPAAPQSTVVPTLQSIALKDSNTLYLTRAGAVLKLDLGNR